MNQTREDRQAQHTLQYLQWELMCCRATPTEFQRIFEEVAKRLWPGFMKVRPYGREGDRKCDGIIADDGTFFAVYSPHTMTESEAIRKIERDLSGAVREWGQRLRKWVFVYNTRFGVPPGIPDALFKQREVYPNIKIESMSDADLWDRIAALPIDKRAEILGVGEMSDSHPLLNASSENISKTFARGRVVLIHEADYPIDTENAVLALEPEMAFGPPLRIAVPAQDRQDGWERLAAYQRGQIERILLHGTTPPRFAVFSLVPIPLAVHLGYVFTDRIDIKCFQYQRDRNTWQWGHESGPYVESIRSQCRVDPARNLDSGPDAIIRVSLSAEISSDDTRLLVNSAPMEIDLFVEHPDVSWLRRPAQLSELAAGTRDALKGISDRMPNCERIHLFYAGPAPGAIAIGQAINPTMNPPVLLYQYKRREAPRYNHVLTLD